jgi:hypothetical protein
MEQARWEPDAGRRSFTGNRSPTKGSAMTTPIVNEIPRHLEPITEDPFLSAGDQPRVVAHSLRELDHRRSDGIDVTLLWRQSDGQVLVAVCDTKTGQAFEIAVDPAHSLNAFHHPFAYAASR